MGFKQFMKINKVEISNFYSVKNAVLNFDKFKGVVLVEGKNKDTGGSNGSGKSAMIEAVVWGLFGKTIRKSTEEALVNSQSKKGCVVKITVNDNTVIERGRKPTHLKFTVGDTERTQANALETQKVIEETLNTNYKVFLASTVFGQQNTMGFINATPDDKRTIIKNFLKLDDLFSLRDSVKKLKSSYSQTVKKQDAIIETRQKNLASFDKKLKSLSKLREDVEGKYDEATLSLSLEEVLEAEKANASAAWEMKLLARQMNDLDVRIINAKQQIKLGPVIKTCSTCGQEVEEDHLPEKLQNDIDGYLEKMILLDEDHSKEFARIVEIPISSSKYHKIIEYNQLKKETETFTELKAEATQEIQEAHDLKQDYNTRYETMRFWEKAFSESGLVKYIIRNILKYLNGKVNFYLSHLSKGKFFLEFDEELKETITHQNREVHYISLSGGEKRKIDLAVLLGLQQLLAISSTEESNLMFFDEIAENLDQDGLDGLYILLSELKKDKTLFVITHNNYLKSLLDNVRTLTITKSKGVSTLKK
jgi:DNA repair exonuclease SbcCD ATPase subunit